MTVFAEPIPDGVTEAQQLLIDTAPGSEGNTHINLPADVAGHFISEDAPDEVTAALLDFIASTQ